MSKIAEFVVVEFLKEKAVGLIHRTWIERDMKDELWGYWPSFGQNAKVKKGAIPDKGSWRKYRIRIIASSTSFAKAMAQGRRAEETSNVETEDDDDDESYSPRKVHKPARYQDGESYDSDETEEEDNMEMSRNLEKHEKQMATLAKLPQLQKAKTVEATRKVEKAKENVGTMSCAAELNEPDDQPSPTVTPQRARASSSSRSNQLFSSRSTPKPTSDRMSDTPKKQESIKDCLDLISKRQEDIILRIITLRENQVEITQMLRHCAMNTGQVDDDLIENQATTPEELAVFCDKLQDKNIRKQMVLFLVSMGGTNLGDSIRRMLSKIGTNGLWSDYSLKGKKGKKPFFRLPIMTVITKACMKIHPTVNMAKVDDEVGEALKHAPKRKGGSKYVEPSAAAGEEQPAPLPSDSDSD